MGFTGKKSELPDGRDVAVLYNGQTQMFMLEFAMPVPDGYTETEAVTKSQQNKVYAKDGKLVTSFTLSYGAFMAMMSMGCDVANEAIANQEN